MYLEITIFNQNDLLKIARLKRAFFEDLERITVDLQLKTVGKFESKQKEILNSQSVSKDFRLYRVKTLD